MSKDKHVDEKLAMRVNYFRPFDLVNIDFSREFHWFTCYGAEGGVLELLETGAPYAPHVKAKIT